MFPLVPALEELFWLARQLELVDLRRTGLVAGPALAAWQDEDALITVDDLPLLDLWREVFALVETGRQLPGEAHTAGSPPFRGILTSIQRCVPGMLVSLYHAAAHDGDQQVATLVAALVEGLLGRWKAGGREADEEEMANAALRVALSLALDRLIGHGVLEISGLRLPEPSRAAELETDGLPVRAVLLAVSDQARVRLTPLGRWAMRESLLAEGAEAPATVMDAGDAPALLDLDAGDAPALLDLDAGDAPALLDLDAVGAPTSGAGRQ